MNLPSVSALIVRTSVHILKGTLYKTSYYIHSQFAYNANIMHNTFIALSRLQVHNACIKDDNKDLMKHFNKNLFNVKSNLYMYICMYIAIYLHTA